MPKVSQAILSFLTVRKAAHNGPDLLERYLQYAGFMETQVNVSAGKGWPVDGKKSTYTDGLDEWFNIRIPKNANSDPEFKDYELRFPLDLHADAIGATGWDWAARKSRWLGFDFDSITGHAAGVGIKDDELERVKEAACALPWVEVRRSTGGNGLHLYVYFDDAGVPTENHTVHAALGRAVLGMMSSETGFDFSSHIDACGGNMWIWARKMTRENQGLLQIKPAAQPLLLKDLPVNWRDHVEVVTRKRSKIRINGVETEGTQDPFEELASSRRRIDLDDKHKQILDELRASGFTTVWVPDYHMLQTHTCAFQKLMEDKKKELGLVGFFKTISEGKDPGTQNCFAFPLENGGWKVYLYGQGRAEAETWEQDGQGWTTCYFNKQPNLKVAARAMGGMEDAEKGGFVFESAAGAMKAAEALGRKLPIPERLRDREVTLKAHKDGRLVAKVDKKDGDVEMPGQGWQAKKGGYWLQVFETKTDTRSADLKVAEFDNVIRALKTPAGDRAGWMMFDDTNAWVRVPREEAKAALLTLGHSKPEADVILGMAGKKNWSIVNLPFQPEYPGDRQWNQGAAQYKYKPADLPDDMAPHHPHWDRILKHCGQDLDEAIKNLDWARQANIKSGADYLKTWAACMLQEPYEKLPYLFFYGEQNSGKSIFHEALALLMTKGVAAADRALTNANDFNGELANAVLAVVEEKDISLTPGAYNKLKDWVTSPTIWIRKMRTDAYPQINTLHFVQTANERDACKVNRGDTRITMLFVPLLDRGEEIAKTVLIDRLKEEAPHFMRTIIDLQLPQMTGRLRLPVVSTDNKERAQESARSPVEQFIAERCFEVDGAMILFKEFHERFKEWLHDEGIDGAEEWKNKEKVKKALPYRFPYGIRHSNQQHVGNLSWENVQPQPGAKPLVVKNGKLKPKGD
jgi:hypothetical protein